jgi:molecular chaperone DnaK (HSP70)
MLIDNELHPVLGIDLGTTFSAIAQWDAGRAVPRHYQMRDGADTLQSVVYYEPKSEEYLVGSLAYKKGLLFPDNMALGIKRHMDDASHKIALGGREFTPVDLSSRILQRLYADVSEKFPTGRFRSRGSVVTVPYYFKAHQCENTRKAAELANIECIGIIQEPIAASLSYAWQLIQDRPEEESAENILVFDLGGGTFDLTLFRLERRKDRLVFEVLATGGDDRLGGMDFDRCLAELLLEKGGLSLAGLSPVEERKASQKILSQAIDAKITLGAVERTYVSVADVIPGQHIDTEVTRDEFEACIKDYIDEIESIISTLWSTAGMRPEKVDRVIRVGGSSKIPRMKELLSDQIGESKVWGNVDAALCVAEGAAMYAAYLDDREIFGRDIEIHTRTCHALGVETSGGGFYAMIPVNRKTPCEHRQIFTTDADDMSSLDINVYQGAARLARDNALIGAVSVSGLPRKRKGELDIHVTFKVSEEQMLSVIVEAEGMRKTANLKFA